MFFSGALGFDVLLASVRGRMVALFLAAAGVAALWGVVVVGSARALPTGCSQSGTTVTCTYTSAGTSTFMVPKGVSTLDVTAVGAAGGAYLSDPGGAGASVEDTAVPVSANQVLDMVVGGVGGDGGQTTGGAGGTPGGGGAGGDYPSGNSDAFGQGGGGGGYSGLLGPSSTPLVIAAGGGGAGGETFSAPGGYGDIGAGGGNGGTACSVDCGGGGGGAEGSTVGSAGGGALGGSSGNPGMSLAGGQGGASNADSGDARSSGAGGGGGYAGGGGGGGGFSSGGGGGGSSYGVGPGLSNEKTATGAASVTITYSSLPAYQPDAQIKLTSDTSYRGVGTINTTGASQTRTTTTARGNSANFDLRLVNAGTHPDAIAVRGCKSSTGFTVKYLKGTTNITTKVTAGTYKTATLAAGGSRVLKLKVAVSSTASAGKLDTCAVTASSNAAPTKKDVVKAKVKVG